MRRARFLVAYDGRPFRGFAANEGVATVMGTFRSALERVVRQPVELTGAGRTDAGVHAWGQVISGDLPSSVDLGGLQRRLNKLLGPHIAVRSVEWADAGFDARFSATARHYRYHVWNASAPHPLLAGRVWHVPQPLRLWVMQAATAPLIGEHDFASFCRRVKVGPGEPERTLVRRVLSARWSVVEGAAPEAGQLVDEGEGGGEPGGGAGVLRFEIAATAFCHQMVRSIVGTLVDVGLGRISAGDVRAILHARDRNAAGRVAPPDGLVLWRVDYEG